MRFLFVSSKDDEDRVNKTFHLPAMRRHATCDDQDLVSSGVTNTLSRPACNTVSRTDNLLGVRASGQAPKDNWKASLPRFFSVSNIPPIIPTVLTIPNPARLTCCRIPKTTTPTSNEPHGGGSCAQKSTRKTTTTGLRSVFEQKFPAAAANRLRDIHRGLFFDIIASPARDQPTPPTVDLRFGCVEST
jgi:hypothetical protein